MPELPISDAGGGSGNGIGTRCVARSALEMMTNLAVSQTAMLEVVVELTLALG